MADLPLIPSTVVGSHGKPGWWFATVKAYEAGEYGPGDLDEMFDDAADTAIRDMERAGLDIITDGEVRRLDGYVDSYYAIIKGIAEITQRGHAVLIAESNIHHVPDFATRLYVIERGEIIFAGRPDDVRTDAAALRATGGHI